MDEKDPNTYTSTYSMIPHWWVFLMSVVAGAVNYLGKVKKGQVAFKLSWFGIEMLTAVFSGWVTYHLCVYADLPENMMAVFVAISAHAGGKTIEVFEAGYEAFVKRVMGNAG